MIGFPHCVTIVFTNSAKNRQALQFKEQLKPANGTLPMMGAQGEAVLISSPTPPTIITTTDTILTFKAKNGAGWNFLLDLLDCSGCHHAAARGAILPSLAKL